MEKKTKEKDMTINDLAGLMLKSFQSNQEYMDRKFDGIDKKFAEVDKKFLGIDKKFLAIDEKFLGIDEKFKGVNYKLDNIDKKLGTQEKIIFEHDQKIDKLEADMKEVKKALAV